MPRFKVLTPRDRAKINYVLLVRAFDHKVGLIIQTSSDF